MTLTEEQIAVIARHPIGASLDGFRQKLASHADISGNADDDGGVNAAQARMIITLLTVLIDAAYDLPEPCSQFSELLALLPLHAKKGRIKPEAFRPLVDAVIGNAPDVEVWGAALALGEAIKHPTTPRKSESRILRPTFTGTPVKVSSSRLDDSETRDVVEDELFYEIRNCTFRGVGGFEAKFFNPATWKSDHRRMLEKMLEEGAGETRPWAFPLETDENSVWTWLRSLESRFLDAAPNKLHKNYTPYEFKSSIKGQMDVLFLSAAREESQRLEYKHVLLVGELKQSHSSGRFKGDLLQLTRLVRSIFADQPTRRFVHGFTLCASTMELWVFDRAGAYSSGAFDILLEPKRFAHAFVGYATMDNEAIGQDVFIRKEEGNYEVTLDDITSSSSGDKQISIRLTKPLVKQKAIVCRGTTCYSTDNGQVAKFAWASVKRALEVNQLKEAMEKGVEGVASAVAYRQITTIAELRRGLDFSKPHRFRQSDTTTPTPSSSGSKRRASTNAVNSKDGAKRPRFDRLSSGKTKQSQETPDGMWEDRIFSCLVVSPAGRIISEFCSVKELLESMRDAMRAHQSLYTLGGILHRDISSNNIIITKPETPDDYKGMLIDLDLAKAVNDSSRSARQQTGTMQFIAIGVLQGADHTYRHDLESFFYVLLWMCAIVSWEKSQFRGEETEPLTSRLNRWVVGDFKTIESHKVRDMVVFEDILEEFPEAMEVVKPLCWKLNEILFPSSERGAARYGTPSGPPATLYRSIIEAYDDVISGLS
ncbi:serine/threonine-protein kinase Sgk2 [Xylaria palmicola]|nr:serine/threonine-protein kinase Sgk2 [Xylaria palmicola]